jgi:hypothetical protein
LAMSLYVIFPSAINNLMMRRFIWSTVTIEPPPKLLFALLAGLV